MDDARHYSGPLAADDAHGLYGGTCTLLLRAGRFELQLGRSWMYGIEDTDTVRGTFVATHAGADLDAREWHSCTIETAVVESSVALSRTWHVRHVGPVEDPSAIVALRFALGPDAFDLLLLRGGEAAPAPAIGEAFAATVAHRQADAEAARHRREANARRDQRAAASAQAFAAGDFPSVVALLAPAEDDLSRAEAMRLALARRQMNPVARR